MLPTIDLPTYKLKLPSNGKEITIRPFLVREEKLLLMALESGDEREIIDTTKQIVNNCIVDGDVDVNKLPFFDVDYLFIALRAKSVGESVEIKFTCNAFSAAKGDRCGHVFPAKIDVANCSVIKRDDIPMDIRLNDKVSVRMKYPSYTTMKMILNDDNVIEKKISIMVGSIEHIMDGENIMTPKDFTSEDLFDFIESLTQEQYRKLENFVDNLPSFIIQTEAVCEACGYQHYLEYKEFASFFD